MNRPPPSPAKFPGVTPPSTDFEAVLDGMRSPLLMVEIDLTTARDFAAGTAMQVKITGNAFYIDQAADVGAAFVIFEGVQDDTSPKIRPAVYVQPGYVARVPFANLRVANAAQAGKVLRIIYGVDVDFVPSLNGQIAISGSVQANIYPVDYGACYKSNSLIGAGATDMVFSPASNIAGAIVWDAAFMSQNSGAVGYSSLGFIAANAAPGTLTAGDPLLLPLTYSNNVLGAKLGEPVRLPAGQGLYYFTTLAEANTVARMVKYTLL